MRARCFSGGRRDWVVGSGGGMRPLRRGGEGAAEGCEFVHGEVVAKERKSRGDRIRLRDIQKLSKSQRHTSTTFYFKNKHFILGILTRRARPAVPNVVPTCTPGPAAVVRVTRRTPHRPRPAPALGRPGSRARSKGHGRPRATH